MYLTEKETAVDFCFAVQPFITVGFFLFDLLSRLLFIALRAQQSQRLSAKKKVLQLICKP